MRKWIATLLTCLMLVCALPVTALAASPDSAEDLWTLMGDTVYSCDGYTLRATTQDGDKIFLFEGVPCSFGYQLDSMTYECDGDWGEYCLTIDDAVLSFILDDGQLSAVQVYGAYYETDDDTIYVDGAYVDPTVAPNGTYYHPWPIGATEDDKVYAYCENGFLTIMGSGIMQDFEDPADRPWDAQVSEVDFISVEGEVTAIGKNAFAGAGAALPVDDYVFGCVDVYFNTEALTTIGDNAFAGAKLGGEIFLPDSVTSIGSRAFADIHPDSLWLPSSVPTIAADAFAGASTQINVLIDGNWTDADKQNYGGQLTWCDNCVFQINQIYNVEDMEGVSAYYVPLNEEFALDLNEVDYDADFVKVELVSGDFPINDPKNPLISGVVTGNVTLAVYLEVDEEIPDDPEEPIDDPIDDPTDDDSTDEPINDPVVRPVKPDPQPVPSPKPVIHDEGNSERKAAQKTTTTTSTDQPRVVDNPQTGDNIQISLYLCLASFAALVMTVLIYKKKNA